jgi:RHS repeat-associated protein
VRKQFTGYERDDETGLDFAEARMFNCTAGRFGTPDPYNVILEKERGEDEDERADILIGFISNPQRWNTYIYVVNNPLAFTDADGQNPRTINVFLQEGVSSPEELEDWKKWAASQDKNKVVVNIYLMSKDTPGTINAFIASLKAKDTATIFMGHSLTHKGNQIGIIMSGRTIGNSQDQRQGNVSNTADGIDIQNAVLAIFSCSFGKGFDNITSSSGTAFVSIVQGQEQGAHPTTYCLATNAAAFRFTQSIAKGTWTPMLLPGELDAAKAEGDSGIRAFPHPTLPEVNAGDRVNYRILPPPRKKG